MDQFMPLQPGHCVAEEEDWEIVERDWWRTSFRDVPWSYVSPSNRMAKKPQRRRFFGSLFHNRRHRTSSTMPFSSAPSGKERRASDEDDSLNLNMDHIGVNVALEALVAYESDTGFHFTGLPEFSLVELGLAAGMDLNVELDEKELAAGNKKLWDELLEELMNGPAFESTTDSDDSLESSFIGSLSSSGELHRSTSTFSTMTFVSEGSIDSIGMPSTPKPKSSFHEIEIKDTSPTGSISGGLDYHPHFLSPTRSLNAAASSFIPTFCSQLNDEPLQFPTLGDKPKPSNAGSSSSDSFANFTFPTLNAHAPPVKVNGVFNEPQGQSSSPPDSNNGLLPPFLQEPSQWNRTRKSRTREIVDRLRSRLSPADSDAAGSQAQQANAISPKYASHSPSPIGDEPTFVPPRLSVSEDGGDRVSRLSSPSCEEDDGWIDVSQPAVTSSSQKSKRARELLFALTRRRTDSLTSENLKEMMSNSEPTPNQNGSPSPSPSPNPPAMQTTSDGWIESSTNTNLPSEGQKKTKSRTPAQNSKEGSKHHGQAQHNNHNRKKSSNHVSRTSTSSVSHSHPHPHSQQQQHSQYNASSSCYPPYSTGAPGAAPSLPPHMVPPQTIPYFFPAYPAVSMPVPYTAFMQMPAYHMGAMPMHANAAPMQFAPMPTPTLGVQPLSTGSAGMKTSMTSSSTAQHMNVPPAFRTKHPQPLW